MSHNHNHNYNHNHKSYKSQNGTSTSYNERVCNQIKQMTNFEPLPPQSPHSSTHHSSTPQSSSTPGAPPFDITTTPFFKGDDAYYAIHPDTLRQLSENNEFGLINLILINLFCSLF